MMGLSHSLYRCLSDRPPTQRVKLVRRSKWEVKKVKRGFYYPFPVRTRGARLFAIDVSNTGFFISRWRSSKQLCTKASFDVLCSLSSTPISFEGIQMRTHSMELKWCEHGADSVLHKFLTAEDYIRS